MKLSALPPGQHLLHNHRCDRCGVVTYGNEQYVHDPETARLLARGGGWLQPDGLLSRQEPSCWFVRERCPTKETPNG